MQELPIQRSLMRGRVFDGWSYPKLLARFAARQLSRVIRV